MPAPTLGRPAMKSTCRTRLHARRAVAMTCSRRRGRWVSASRRGAGAATWSTYVSSCPLRHLRAGARARRRRGAGVGAHLTALRRTRIGPFRSTGAHHPRPARGIDGWPLADAVAAAFPRVDVSADVGFAGAAGSRFGQPADPAARARSGSTAPSAGCSPSPDGARPAPLPRRVQLTRRALDRRDAAGPRRPIHRLWPCSDGGTCRRAGRHGPRVVAIGVFDGVHYGHRPILTTP